MDPIGAAGYIGRSALLLAFAFVTYCLGAGLALFLQATPLLACITLGALLLFALSNLAGND